MVMLVRPTQKVPKTEEFFKWPLEAGSQSQSIPMRTHIKMSNFSEEINMYTYWYKKHVHDNINVSEILHNSLI